MRLEIDIPEHHYNNIMALDSVSLGRAPYKGIIMYAINAIKQGKVLDQESTTKNDSDVQKAIEIIKADSLAPYSVNEILSARDLAVEALKQMATTKNYLGVDCISRADAIRVASGYCHPSNVAKELAKLPSVTPQEPKTGHWREDIDNNRRWDRVRFYCSECGDWQIYGKTHYCPNCGAKMQSEAE